MASKKIEIDGAAIAAAVARDLPGFRVVKKTGFVAEASAVDAEKPCDDRGPTLQQLRRKFLGEAADAADAADSAGAADGGAADDYGAMDAKRVSVQVEPDEGGPAKTADVENGRVKIVQG